MTDMPAGKLWGLRRLADGGGRFKMLAVDQRPPIEALVAERRGADAASYDDVCAVKALLTEQLGPHASAVLVDPHYAYPAAIRHVRPAQGLLLTLEDSVFAETPGGRRSSSIDAWSVGKIKRAGGDAVKVLAWYRPDAAPDVLAHQQEYVAGVGADCARYDLPFVFELLVYPLPGDAGHTTDYVEQPGKRAEHVLASVAEFAKPRYGVDLLKLESPLPAGDLPPTAAGTDDARRAQALFDEMGELAGRPWVMLSAGASAPAFRNVLDYAYRAGASGFLAGRAIWWEAFQAFPDLDAMGAALEAAGVPYLQDIAALTDAAARPWTAAYPTAPRLAGAGPAFRHAYEDLAPWEVARPEAGTEGARTRRSSPAPGEAAR